jgi:superfamily II DNA or RNA helicase
MVTLRDYQIDGINALSIGWKQNKRQVFALTTGGGKTVCFTEIANRAVARNKTVLILTHRKELFEQAGKTFGSFGLKPTLIHAKEKHISTENNLFIAMVETISKRVQLMESVNPNLIIIDECHIGNFTKILNAFPETYTLGVTATPVGKHFFEYYTNIVQTIDTPDLVEQGYLANCIPYQMVKQVPNLKTKQGEFTDASLMEFFDNQTLYDGVITEYKKFALGKKTLIFNCNISHSEEMAKQFCLSGIKSMSLTSKNTPQERIDILNWFESTSDAVLNNAGILTAGYDHPPIECIIVNRATKSLPLWLQMVGRGSRVTETKNTFTLLDFGGNHQRHGLWNQPRKWELEPPKEKKIQEAPVKECPRCSAMLYASARVCNFCDYVYPEEKKELIEGVMVEVTANNVIGLRLSDLCIDQIVAMCKSQRAYNVNRPVLWRVVRSMGEDAVREYAKKMTYKYGWTLRQLDLLDDCGYTNTKIQWAKPKTQRPEWLN